MFQNGVLGRMLIFDYQIYSRTDYINMIEDMFQSASVDPT